MYFENLTRYGFSPRFRQEASAYEGFYPARVSEQHRELYKLILETGELQATVSGRLAFEAQSNADFPAVGDWVMVDRPDAASGNAVIHHVLSRKSVFARKAAGTANDVQIVAANIDILFICMSLNLNFNVRRLERYLSIAWESMATPVVVLTKADLCEELPEKLMEVSAVCPGVEVLPCSSMTQAGFDAVRSHVQEGRTIAFIGSSGVGKSTLINQLMGTEVLVTHTLSTDDKGRHTTTHRQLLLLPGGGIVIDTPGMRELQLESGNLSKSFEDIELLSSQCKFSDCSHHTEPGCAIKRAIAEGILLQERFDSYKKLQKELSREGKNARQIEQEKITRMFGGKNQMKQAMRAFKNKNKS